MFLTTTTTTTKTKNTTTLTMSMILSLMLTTDSWEQQTLAIRKTKYLTATDRHSQFLLHLMNLYSCWYLLRFLMHNWCCWHRRMCRLASWMEHTLWNNAMLICDGLPLLFRVHLIPTHISHILLGCSRNTNSFTTMVCLMWFYVFRWDNNYKAGNFNQVAVYAVSHPWHGVGQVHCPDFKTVSYLRF